MKRFLSFIFFASCLLPIANCFSQGTWLQKANLPGTSRLTAVAFTIGTKGYLGTGSVGFGSSVSDFWQYDPALNTWTQKANFGGGPRGFACGFSIGTKGYIGTGLNNSTYYNDFWEYDPVLNTWTQKANVNPTLRWCAVAFAVNGKGYIAMGNNQSYVAQQDVWEYDPTTNTWAQKANYIGVRCDVDRATFVIGSKAYCGTGANVGTTPALNYNDFWQYDPALDSWTQMANFPGNKRYGATGFSVCGEGYLGLGQDSTYAFYSDFFQYDPGTNSWTPATAFTNQRCDAASFVVGSKAYVCAGSFGTSPFVMYNDLWEFTPSGIGTLSITATSTVVCVGSTVTLTASGGNMYTWDNGSTTTSIIVSPVSSATFTATDSSSACAISGSIAINVVPQPTVTITGNNSICLGTAATLYANGGTDYSWSSGETTSSITVSPTTISTYTVISSAGQCSDTNSITVNVSPLPVANIICIDTICLGQNAVLSASGGTDYSWNTGYTTSSIIISPTSNTNYSVVVSENTCADTAYCSVFVKPVSAVTAYSNVTITAGSNATLSASGGTSYVWSNGASGSAITVSPPTTTKYCVTLADISGCTDSACVTVTVKPDDCSLSSTGQFFIPDAFSPNGDGENETLKLYYGNIACIKTYLFVIYNRWGEKIFETSNPLAEWDGIYKSKMEGSAVFVYYMKATLVTNQEIIKKGNISLLR